MFFNNAGAATIEAPPEVTILANQRSRNITLPTPNSGVQLEWQSKNADSCIAEGSWQGARALNGDLATESIAVSRTYILSCSNAYGTTKQPITINVLTPASGPLVNTNVTINDGDSVEIEPNQSVRISWRADNANTCLALNQENYWSGSQQTTGAVTVSNITKSSAFVLSCFNQYGSHEVSVVANVHDKTTQVIPIISTPATSVAPTNEIPIKTATSGVIITRWLVYGSKGDDVRQLQEYFKKLGYFPQIQDTTMFFGRITQQSVQKFQCARLKVCSGTPESTGYGAVGPRTRALLKSI